MLIYWSIIALLLPLFSLLDLFVSWVPLYSTFKALILLFFAIPQTHGSEWLYLTIVEPWLRTNESSIDAKLGEVKTEIVSFGKGKARDAWNIIMGTLGQQPSLPTEPVRPPPSMNDPISGPLQLAAGWWQTYGPALTAVASTSGLFNAQSAPPPGVPDPRDQRRQQLEAELASLRQAGREDDFPTPDPITISSSSSDPIFASSRPSSNARLRRSNRGFDESDVDDEDEDDGVGYDYRPSSQSSQQNQGWMGGWFSPTSSPGYERTKND